jgi:transcriptional regulator with XRE-family HTH domain
MLKTTKTPIASPPIATRPPTFADRLHELRTAAGLSSYDLARKARMRFRQITALESGMTEPTFEVACRLADALGVSLDAFRGI